MRTIPNISHLFHPLEKVIRQNLIPLLTDQPPPNDLVRDLLALPARLGGIAITNPTKIVDFEFSSSAKISDPLTSSIIHQTFDYSPDVIPEQLKMKSSVRKNRLICSNQAATIIKESLPPSLDRAMEEKGASIWLTSRPIKEFGFSLHKRDALALRYNWAAFYASHQLCLSFSIDHSLSCPKGGFPSIRHNEIRDLTANLLTEVCNNVTTSSTKHPTQQS